MAKPHAEWNQPIIEQFRASGGSVTTRGYGRNLVLVHNVGAKTGEERIAPVLAVREGPDAWIIAAAKGGAPENPAWYHNLRAQPDVDIEVPDEGAVPVHVEELAGAARERALALFAPFGGLDGIQEKTTRVIPVLRLSRRTE
ncbi:nitroreductase/quinone reductase family protein [Microbacterium sp.]|uniref:nitroreductase/quinone reductase family protein n=1 Tax=Microbacterium sp. TaxID=51671 RepID=UPI0025FEE093|nr:nitroreductase/quinone reductase family protein [Microbacterium sp.]